MTKWPTIHDILGIFPLLPWSCRQQILCVTQCSMSYNTETHIMIPSPGDQVTVTTTKATLIWLNLMQNCFCFVCTDFSDIWLFLSYPSKGIRSSILSGCWHSCPDMQSECNCSANYISARICLPPFFQSSKSNAVKVSDVSPLSEQSLIPRKGNRSSNFTQLSRKVPSIQTHR